MLGVVAKTLVMKDRWTSGADGRITNYRWAGGRASEDKDETGNETGEEEGVCYPNFALRIDSAGSNFFRLRRRWAVVARKSGFIHTTLYRLYRLPSYSIYSTYTRTTHARTTHTHTTRRTGKQVSKHRLKLKLNACSWLTRTVWPGNRCLLLWVGTLCACLMYDGREIPQAAGCCCGVCVVQFGAKLTKPPTGAHGKKSSVPSSWSVGRMHDNARIAVRESSKSTRHLFFLSRAHSLAHVLSLTIHTPAWNLETLQRRQRLRVIS